MYVRGGHGLSQGLLSPPSLSPALLLCSAWRLAHFLPICEGKSLGCLSSPPYTAERRSQLDSSAKCPDFSPLPAPSMESPFSFSHWPCWGVGVPGWSVGGDWCPSQLTLGRGPVRLCPPNPVLLCPLSFGCAAWGPAGTPEGQGNGHTVLEQLAAVLWPLGPAGMLWAGERHLPSASVSQACGRA